jgi:hypothetical protein
MLDKDKNTPSELPLEAPIVNKVATSSLITLSLEDFYPKGERKSLDLAPWLYEGMILREKEFRKHIQEHDWSIYKSAYVAVHCSADAIIPQWAYMLVGTALEGTAAFSVFGDHEALENHLMEQALAQFDFSQYKDQRVILKGCSDLPISPQAYFSFATRLKPFAKSIMFGEACSTVPIYKRK